MDFEKKALEFSGKLTAFRPFPNISDRNSWETLLPTLREELIRQGDEAVKTPFPVLRATDYMAFLRTGNRVIYETPYFSRRHLLNKLVLAECVEAKGCFLDAIIDASLAICEESTWCLPAHNSYLRDTPQGILPDCTRPVLDLFACETGAQLAMLLYLLEDTLNEVSPLITNRIRQVLRQRIILPYQSTHFWWMGNGDEPMCNWTPWCTQNILLTAFLVDELTDTSERQNIFRKAAASCDLFLKDYGEDGCCDEGAHYYRHAGLCLYACMEILNAISDNAFDSLYQLTKIKNIAAYISNIHVDGPYYFNFADCAAKVGRAGVREFLFGKATGQKFLMDFAAFDFRDAFTENSFLADESMLLNLYFKTQTVILTGDVLAYCETEGASTASTPDVYYESVGIWTARDEHMALAVKAGDNADSHNHNDAGSLILYKDGHPILVDIGVETYTAKTFSANRYDIWTMQSCYHNLPTIEGYDEGAGSEYRVSDLQLFDEGASQNDAEPVTGCKRSVSGDAAPGFTGAEPVTGCEAPGSTSIRRRRAISMNLSTAYPGSDLPPYIRRVEFLSGESTMTLTDVSDAEDVILNFITYEEPVLQDADTNLLSPESGCIRLGSAELHFAGASSPTVEILPITDERLKGTWDHDLYRIRLRKTNNTFRMTVS